MKHILLSLLMFVCVQAQAAELIIFIGTDPSGSFEDGDIIHAMNDARIDEATRASDQWPFTDRELTAHYAVTVDDFSDAVRGQLEGAQYDILGDKIKERRYRVDYTQLAGYVGNEGTVKTDRRQSRSYTRGTIVEDKDAIVP